MWERTSNIFLVHTDTEEISSCGTVMGYQKEDCQLPFGKKLRNNLKCLLCLRTLVFQI